MSVLMFLLGFVALSFAEEPTESIIVEAHRDFEVYVAPPKIKNEAPEIEGVIGDYSIFGYTAIHSKQAKIKNSPVSAEPLTLNHDPFKVYNEDTIKYAWENCDYSKDAKACSYKNNHYLLETYITIDRHQIVVEMFLYDEDLQVISRGSYSSKIQIKWIKQQAIQGTTTRMNSGIPMTPESRNCSGSTCSSGPPISTGPSLTSTTINKPKEELPLKWEIPHMLLDKHVQQASLGCWLGVTLSNL